ncbi:MAG: hypothetical protein ABSF63_15100 [Candidatus Bathyarchaeia archaeon]|jgi:hypothetical protein
MSNLILEREVEAVADQIKDVEQQMRTLSQRQEEAVKLGNDGAAIEARQALKPLGEELEVLRIRKDAAESRLRLTKANQPKATLIRKRIVEELWPKGLKAYGTIQQMFDKLPALLKEANEMDGLIQQLTKEHFQLTGERIQVERFGLPVDLLQKLGELNIFPLPPVEKFQLTDPKLKEVK